MADANKSFGSHGTDNVDSFVENTSPNTGKELTEKNHNSEINSGND